MKYTIAAIAAASLLATGCKEKSPPAPAPQPPQAANTPPKHDDHDGHDHHAPGAAVELGSTTIGPYTVRAARDNGDIKPGGEAPIDAWLTGDAPKVRAVRFWIGTQDAAGSIKAKADIEDPTAPNHWHTHAEVPDPLPQGAQLWVEIEDDNGVKSAGSFDLRI